MFIPKTLQKNLGIDKWFDATEGFGKVYSPVNYSKDGILGKLVGLVWELQEWEQALISGDFSRYKNATDKVAEPWANPQGNRRCYNGPYS
jgi:hypothetical protein